MERTSSASTNATQTSSVTKTPPLSGELSFDKNLWNRLSTVQQYNKSGIQKLNGFRSFASQVNQHLKRFSEGMRQCTAQLEHDMTPASKQVFEQEDYTTLSLAVQCLKSGIDSLTANLDESTHQILGDLIEPLETFTRLYAEETSESLNMASGAWDSFQETIKQSNKERDKYFGLKWDVEKCEIQLEESMLAMERGQCSITKVQRISGQGTQIKYKAEEATQTYNNSVTKVNKASLGLRNFYCPLLLKVQQSEESRINFLKNSIKKMTKHLGGIGSKIQQSSLHIQDQTDFVNSETDLNLFITSIKTVDDLPQADHISEVYQSSVDVQKYKQELAARQVLEAADLDESDEDGVMIFNDPTEKVRKIIYQLMIDQEPITAEDTGYMLESCKLPEVRDSLGQFFKGVAAQKIIKNRDCFIVLGWLLQAFLDQLGKDLQSKEDLFQLEALMQMSMLVCMQEGHLKVYLSTEINEHKLFQNLKMWEKLVTYSIDRKIADAEKDQNKGQANVPPGQLTLQSHLNYAAGGLKMGLNALNKFSKTLQSATHQSSQPHSRDSTSPVKQPQNPYQKQSSTPTLPKISTTLTQNIAYNTQTTFITYFANYQLSFDTSRDLIMFFSQKYNFDKSRTHLLLSELETHQTNVQYKITKKDKKEISLKRKYRAIKRFGAEFMVLGLVIPYVGTDHELGQILRLSKACNQSVKETVYKHALLLCQPSRLKVKRLQIWEHLLQLKDCSNDYELFREKVLKNPELIQNVEEVIMLDVQRSAHSMPGVDMEVLQRLLKTYAYYNPEIEYCQGMNYIAGFLLSLYKDEEVAFKVLIALAEKFKMAELFNPDIPRLKLYFLQLDRMICFANTDLYNHFSNEDVTASYFASAWFITMLTNSLKQNVNDEGTVNESLLQLWDYFLLSGWKAISKLGLYMLTADGEQLTQKSFEEILHHISECPKQVLKPEGLGQDQSVYMMLKKEFKGIPVTFHLNRLKRDFEKSHSNVPGKNKKGK